MLSSCVCWRLRATCAAMTRCLSAISVHWAQLQSRHLQYLLCPFNHETIPWFRQRAHLGVRGGFRSEKDCWITNEVSAIISSTNTWKSLEDKERLSRRTLNLECSTLLTRQEVTDGSLLFNLFFLTFKKFKRLCLRSPWLVQVSK